MGVYPKPAFVFSGKKFMARYGLGELDFYDNGNGSIVTKVDLPDNPPIFELMDDPIVALRQLVAGMIDDALQPQSKLLRAALFVIFDEMNLHATKFKEILDAMDAATSLTDLKARIALVADYPQRTVQQAVAAVKNKINSGGAD